MRVIQIAYNSTSNDIEKCISSVKLFANRNNYDYELLSTIPLEYNHIENLRIISNYHRIDLLASNSNTIFFDWDVLLSDDFSLNLQNSPMFNSMGDNIIYSGDVNFWKNVRNLMGSIDDHIYEFGRIFNVLNSKDIKISSDMIIPNVNFEHLSYSKNKIIHSNKRSKRL